VTILQAPLKDKNDIKIFILFLLRNIHYPLDYVNINDIVVQDGVVNPFDFSECFAELLETGNVEEFTANGRTLYAITDQGISVADTLDSRLLVMLKDKSLKSAMRLLSFKKRGSEIKCEVNPLDDGTYEVRCVIIESRRELLNTRVVVEDKALAERMKYNFTDKPEVVFRGVYAIFSGDINYLIE
jgi:hypothetical protein